MALKGPIVIIDNDPDDLDLIKTALKSANILNKTVTFHDGVEALEYLKTTRENPFIILCDVKMPKMGGLELRQKINQNDELVKKSIPFIFLSEMTEPVEVNLAYKLNVQGFFQKPNSIEEFQEILVLIYSYWQKCVEPNQMLSKI